MSGRRRRVGPTDEWEQIELLCGWPEQRDYELIRPLVLSGASADGRSRDTGAASGRTLQRRAKRFDAEGMESLFGSGPVWSAGCALPSRPRASRPPRQGRDP